MGKPDWVEGKERLRKQEITQWKKLAKDMGISISERKIEKFAEKRTNEAMERAVRQHEKNGK